MQLAVAGSSRSAEAVGIPQPGRAADRSRSAEVAGKPQPEEAADSTLPAVVV